MACFNGSSVVLLITMTLFFLIMTPTCGAVKTRHVRITSELEGGLALTVHCKSKDDDLGVHVLQPEDISPSVSAFFRAVGEEQEKATKELHEALKILEEQGLGDKIFFGGDTIGLVDIACGALSYWFECMEEAAGKKVLEPGTLPRLHVWAQNFKQVPVIKENLPDHEKVLDYRKHLREKFILAKSTAQ